MKYIDKILASKKTVFTYRDISLLLGIGNNLTIKKFFSRWVKSGIFKNLSKGIYTLKEYNFFELGTKIKKNSYVSFETILKQAWIIFQDYGETIFFACDQSGSKQIEWKNFRYIKIKNSILLNPLWIIHVWNYSKASVERAICDRVYISKNSYFDNLDGVDFEKLKEISEIYNNRVRKDIFNLIKNAE